MIFIYDHFKVVEAASTNFFFIIYNLFHTANQLYEDSYTSRTIASSQHHPRETRPLLSQPNLYKNRYIGITYYEFVSYIARNESMNLLTLFFSFSYFFSSFPSTAHNTTKSQRICWFFFLSFNFIYSEKWSQWICRPFFLYLAISFFTFILYMKSSQWNCRPFFLHSAISIFILVLYMKSGQWNCRPFF